MPRATTHNSTSQSQSQPQPAATQAARKEAKQKRKKRVVGHEDEVEAEQSEDEVDDNRRNGEVKYKTNERKANDLVRLALFTEYRRIPLKREDISKKLFGGRVSKDEFEHTFHRAQDILQATFGMELFEILSRTERLRADAARDGARQEGETTIAGRGRAAVVSSRQYILRSVLDPLVIEAVTIRDDEIEEAEQQEIAEWFPEDESRKPDGTLVAWRDGNDDQLTMAGILHVLLALILVNGRVLTDMQLRTYLKRLRLPIGTLIPTNSQLVAAKPLTIDALLAQFVKQSYLDKQKTSLVGGQGVQKRARDGATAAAEEGNVTFEWTWGTRAIAEISEESIGAFVVDFMDNIEQQRENRGADEDSHGLANSELTKIAKRKAKLTKAIGRAAGGGLGPYK